MSAPAHDQVAELLGAYALDAVDPEERAAVDAHVGACPRCQAELAEHVAVAGVLDSRGGDAPVDLWPRIAGGLAAPQPSRARAGAGVRRSVGTRVATAAVAAAAAVVVAVLGVQVGHLRSQVGQLQASADRPLTSAVTAAMADPAARHVTLTASGAGAPAAEVAVLPSGQGYLVDDALSVLPGDRTYQLWGHVGSEWVSLGVLGGHPGAVAFDVGPHDTVTEFAISDERAGGAVQPSGTPVASGA